jgi:putative membrane-bound dehydrogenase-like protein
MRYALSLALLALATAAPAAELPKLNLLFLGDNAGHSPATRFRLLEPVMAARNITMTYTDKLDDLNPENLAKYDGLVIYANHAQGKPEQVKAILDYVAAGKGFIPLHCASYCFINDKDYVDLVGAQFRSHTTGIFRVENVKPDHPIMKGYGGFASWDETYTHTKHNEKDRTVLEYRSERDLKEPWTWVRTHGRGRVFYTAWGHDARTWTNDGFHNLVERGVRWACGQDPALAGPYVDRPEMTEFAKDAKPFEFVPARLPFYPAGERWGTTREPISKMQKALSPQESMKHYSVPKDFEMRPFVTEEKLGGGKPICMTWDERGRLWLALTYDYPNEMQREGEGRDKIVICEDTDGDGTCDKVTEYADKLSIPTSILNAHGGLIVHQAPDTLFLKDADGDGKAEVRVKLLTGWGTNDTHAGPSNLRYGFDNWVYGMCGYSGFNGGVNNERVRFGQGLYRFKVEVKDGKPEVKKLEFLRSTNNNSWGVGFNEDGQLFGSTANGCPLVHLAIPNRYYEKVRGLNPGALPNIALDNHIEPVVKDYRQVDWHGGFTAGAGCSVYTARAYPKEYWNRVAFVSEPTAHLTAAFILQPNGPDYIARYGWNLVAARDDWAAPIDAQVGPDGHVWVIDWYNIVVQHNPTPQGFRTGKGAAYETELRDKKYGRIYRLVYTKAKPEPKVDLKDATPEKLVETLRNTNMGWRMHAQRLLVERGKPDVVPGLGAVAGDAKAEPTSVIHALWTMDGLGVALATGAGEPLGLDHPSPAVRRTALMTMAREGGSAAVIVKAKVLADADAGVRLAALLTLSELPSSDAAGAALAQELAKLTPNSDRAFADATVMAAAAHAGPVLAALGKSSDRLSPTALTAVQRIATSYAVAAPATVGTVLANLGESAASEAVIAGLAAGWPAGKVATLSAEEQQAFAKALTSLSPASRGRLLKLAAAWGVKGLDAQLAEVTQGLLATLADAKASDSARIDAAKQIVEFRPDDEAAAAKLIEATNAASPQLTIGLLDALANSRAKGIGPALVAKLSSLPPTARPVAMRVVLARPEPTKAFLDAVEAGKLRFDMLALDQRTALATHPDKAIAERASKLLAQGGGLPDPDRQKVIEEFTSILKKTGDATKGKKVFTDQCAKCHKHGGEGFTIGPDLSGFAVHPKEEILIHVLDPSRSVEGNYKAYTAKLIDGRVVTGILASETRTSVELLDAENKRHALQRDDLDDLKESPKSLMPEGFEKTLKVEELTDLLEFMTLKGKYVPIPLDKYATIVTTKGMFFDEADTTGRMVFRDWAPKTFNEVPFVLVDPQGDKQKNAIMLYSANGAIPPKMPRTVTVPCNTPAKAIHLLSGVGGWCYPFDEAKTVSMIVRVTYADGKTEDHELRNAVHFADYIRRVEVPGSKFAFALRGQQIRYLAVEPKRTDAVIKQVEFVKGADRTAPIVMAVTVETP